MVGAGDVRGVLGRRAAIAAMLGHTLTIWVHVLRQILMSNYLAQTEALMLGKVGGCLRLTRRVADLIGVLAQPLQVTLWLLSKGL